ncbi:MAG TPA: polysaccharide deacetylase family protein [Solirubrobacteraceae bacterium]|nr:polysaccharide deacetylase family protein [Solirubrobacteraceae bacterium]
MPRDRKRWHSKLVRGTWEMAYGPYPVSIYFVLIKLSSRRLPPAPQEGQTISFTSTAPAHPVANGFPYPATAIATSGLPVALTLDGSSTGCTLSGATVSFTGAGTCVIDANQAGNAIYRPAAQVRQSLTINEAKTVVTLTFDDGYEDMITNALPVLQQDQLHGTFYIISGALNNSADTSPDYMTWSQLQTLYRDGNEIGSHTVLHEALSQVDTDEAIQEICQDRYDLLNPPGLAPGSLGPIASLAYPDGEGIATGSPDTTTDPSTWTSAASDSASTHTIESILSACGLNSARTVAGVDSGSGTPAAVPLTSTDQYDASTADSATTFDDPLDMPTTPSIGSDDGITTAAQVEAWIIDAETADTSVNGWLSLTFHDICATECDSPDGYQMNSTQYTNLIDWIQQQEQAGVIVVKTMAQVVGGPNNPAVVPATTSPTNEWSGVSGWTSTGLATAVVNSTFADATNPSTWYSSPDGPPCYQLQDSGSNTVTPVVTETNGTGYIARVAVTGLTGFTEGGQVTVTKAGSDSDAGIVTTQDLGECSPILAPGSTYTLKADYQSTSAPVFFDVFIRSDSGNWTYWTDDSASPFPATAAGAWGTASWTLPQVLPAGYDGISFGLSFGAAGTLTVDGYSVTG